MDFVAKQLNKIILKKKNQTSSSSSERIICLDKTETINTGSTGDRNGNLTLQDIL